MSLLQIFRVPLAIMVAATFYGCSGDSEEPLKGKGFVEIPAIGAATDGSNEQIDVAESQSAIPSEPVHEQPTQNQPSEEISSQEAVAPVQTTELESAPIESTQLFPPPLQEALTNVLVYFSFDDSDSLSTATDDSGNGNLSLIHI